MLCKKRKLCIPREIFTHHKKSEQSHPFILTRLNFKRIIKDDTKKSICILHQILFWHQMKSILKIILQRWDMSFIWFMSNRSRWHQMKKRATKCQYGKRHYLSFELHFYANKFYLSLCQEHPKGWILQKKIYRCGRHQNKCSTTWTLS